MWHLYRRNEKLIFFNMFAEILPYNLIHLTFSAIFIVIWLKLNCFNVYKLIFWIIKSIMPTYIHENVDMEEGSLGHNCKTFLSADRNCPSSYFCTWFAMPLIRSLSAPLCFGRPFPTSLCLSCEKCTVTKMETPCFIVLKRSTSAKQYLQKLLAKKFMQESMYSFCLIFVVSEG